MVKEGGLTRKSNNLKLWECITRAKVCTFINSIFGANKVLVWSDVCEGNIKKLNLLGSRPVVVLDSLIQPKGLTYPLSQIH